ncbi:MAG TPA: 4-hydroxy-3-methylbut-2-enyl diphosphate reductase [Acidobacteriota bacterium]|nr:4-hydroxy-3-methylbut-2-enyl diphosphate reductase [Acidobacteriota bacterium]
MKVRLAGTAGFCMGVHRAMQIVLAEANKGEGPLLTLGPLIHNEQVLDLLASKGVQTVNDLNGIHAGTGRIVIRAHGIPPQDRQALRKSGLKIIDATCPRVARVQGIIRYYTRNGYSAVIVGDKDHAEVRGLMGYCVGPVHVIHGVREVSLLPHLDQVFVVAQTTQNEQKYREVVEALKGRFKDLLVFDTICDATSQRQREARSFAGQVDAVVVVGGSHSANTQRLVEVSQEAGLPTLHVETEKDLDKEKLSTMQVIGVTAGASTPNWMIKNVVREIERIRGRKETPFRLLLRQVIRFLVLSNLLVAAGAFSFAYAISVLWEKNPDLTFPFLTFLYIYAMRVLNRFLDRGAAVYNDPDKAAFLTRHRRLLIIMGVSAVTAALAISYHVGMTTFLALGGLSLLGIIYSFPLVPPKLRGRSHYSKIKDIPGSRSLSEALAWVAIITLLPLLGMKIIAWPASIICILVVFLMSYTRSVLFDIFQVQGDLVVGTETLPITLGEKRTLTLLKILLTVCALILIGAPMIDLVGRFSFAILLPLAALSFCLVAYEKRWIYPGLAFEGMVEGTFLLSGFLGVVWQAL